MASLWLLVADLSAPMFTLTASCHADPQTVLRGLAVRIAFTFLYPMLSSHLYNRKQHRVLDMHNVGAKSGPRSLW